MALNYSIALEYALKYSQVRFLVSKLPSTVSYARILKRAPGTLGVSLWSCQIWSQYCGEVERGREGGRDRANIAKMINRLVRGSFFWSLPNHLHTTMIKLLLQLNFLLIFYCPNSAQTQPKLSLNSAWTLPQTLPGLHPNSTWTPPWTWPKLGQNSALNSAWTYKLSLSLLNPPSLHTFVHYPYLKLQFSVILYTQYILGPRTPSLHMCNIDNMQVVGKLVGEPSVVCKCRGTVSNKTVPQKVKFHLCAKLWLRGQR